jgi:hypothetical protein
MLNKDVEKAAKARGRTAHTDKEYPAKKAAHESARDRRDVVRSGAYGRSASAAQLRSGRWG